MKIRMKFEKNIKYISHLDLMNAMQKTLSRTGLPIKYSEGYNPHIILSIANPIPVGVIGLCEFADFELVTNEEKLDKEALLKILTAASPEGIKPIDLYFNCNKSFNLAEMATYEIEITTLDSDKITKLLGNEEFLVEKKAKGKIKTINLKDYIFEYQATKTETGLEIKMRCACGNTRNLNPLLIKKALLINNIEVLAFTVKRTGVFDANREDFI